VDDRQAGWRRQRHELDGTVLTGLRVWYADGPSAPRIAPSTAVDLAGSSADAPRQVTLGWMVEQHQWYADRAESRSPNSIHTVLAGYGLSGAVNAGHITALPVKLSKVPALIESDPPDVAVVSGVRVGNGLAFAGSVGWADVLARASKRVVVEIDDGAADLGTPAIEGNIVATVPRPPAPAVPPVGSRPADEVDLAIGAAVVSLLPDEPTLQFGPGGIGEGIARALDRPVRIVSGMVNDAMAGLLPRGLLLEPVMAAYAWGGAPIEELAAAGMLQLRSITFTHDLTRLSATHRFVGCNTAVQLGLDGAVNVERVGCRTIAAIGGHADFCVAASRSVGGMSIIAARSTTTSGASTIVPTVDVVSTPRSDIDVVVTEHGIADLRWVGDDERAERLIAVAAPQHRDVLTEAWKDRRS
jgi:acyl-CoA hydrolase